MSEAQNLGAAKIKRIDKSTVFMFEFQHLYIK